MEDFIRSGRIADIILVALAAEAAILGVYLSVKGHGRVLISILASIVAGGALVLAFREVLRNSGWLFVAIYLAAALLAHIADIALRLSSARQAGGPPSRDQ